MESHDRDQLDDLLDGALRQYGDVEPRDGLEQRILANLASPGLSASHRKLWSWRWSVSAGVAACVLVAVWIGVNPSRNSHRSEISQTTSTRVRSSEPVAVKRSEPARVTEPPPAAATTIMPRQVRHVPRVQTRVAMHREPRLSRFPSPQPLSAQEVMLVEYVQRYPEDAKLIAKEQAEFQERIEQAEQQLGSGSNANE